MSVTDSHVKTQTLDYSLRSIAAPKYKFVRIPMNNHSSSSTSITSTSTELLEWKLPVQIYNLARSYIAYSLDIPASNDSQIVTFEDTFDIAQSATFGSAGGVDLVNIQNLQNYVKIARKLATPMEDYLSNDDMSQLYKCNSEGDDNKLPFEYTLGENDGVDHYMESKYIQVGLADSDVQRYRQFPLGAIPGTLFAVDRDFYSPVEQYLRITAGVGDKTAFRIETVAAADPADPDVVSYLPVTRVDIKQCYLYLAVEQNVMVQRMLLEQYQSGKMSYRIPYTTGFKNVGSDANTQTNIQIQISQQYGKRLRRILHSVWHPADKLDRSYDCSNWDGSKIQTYQTFMDSLPLQDRILSCKRPSGHTIASDDWLENKKFMDKRSCFTSRDMYALNWFHVDQWYEPHDKRHALPADVNLDEGLIMDTSKSWTFSGEAGSVDKLLHCTWDEFSRDIEVTVAGPRFL